MFILLYYSLLYLIYSFWLISAMLTLEIYLTLPKRSSNISDTRVYHLPHNDQNFIEILLKPVAHFAPNNFKMMRLMSRLYVNHLLPVHVELTARFNWSTNNTISCWSGFRPKRLDLCDNEATKCQYTKPNSIREKNIYTSVLRASTPSDNSWIHLWDITL